jgi:hypothetical protein
MNNWVKLYILDEFKNPVRAYDPLEWAKWWDTANRIVQQDTIHIGDGQLADVSTVFLGLDHQRTTHKDGPPILWETMIFNGPLDGYCKRYSTRQEAVQGHTKALTLLQERVTADSGQ